MEWTEEVIHKIHKISKVGYKGKIYEVGEMLDEIKGELDSADTIVYWDSKTETEGTVEIEHYRTSWLARYRKTQYGYVLGEDVSVSRVWEKEMMDEDDDWEAVYLYEIKGDYVVIEVDINNFDNEHEFTKTLWIWGSLI